MQKLMHVLLAIAILLVKGAARQILQRGRGISKHGTVAKCIFPSILRKSLLSADMRYIIICILIVCLEHYFTRVGYVVV